MKKILLLGIIAAVITLILLSCNRYHDLKDYTENSSYPLIFPDYTEIVIPPNIAPLNFDIREKGLKYLVKVSAEKGKTVNIPARSSIVRFKKRIWKKLLTSNRGKEIRFDVFVFNTNRKWIKYKPFTMQIAEESIDAFLAYRLINVGYILWEKMGIYQRDLTSFSEKPIMHNRNTKGNCINCHSFCNNNPDRIMFHMRDEFSGTVVSVRDSIFKVNMESLTDTIVPENSSLI